MFGWTINGPLNGTVTNENVLNRSPVMVNRISELKLEELWKQQFKADFPETAHDEQIESSKEDQQFMDFVSRSAKLIDGHYHIGLPFRNTDVIM